MLVDYHIHTNYSDDCEYPMEEVVRDAVSMGITELCFTDHVDYGVKTDWDSGERVVYKAGMARLNVDYKRYYKEVLELRIKYADKIKLKLGMEFGVQMHTLEKYEKLFAGYPFDFIILSLHQVENKEIWCKEFQEGRSWKEYNECYYREMLALVQNYKNYSVLGHIDFITRYDDNGKYPFEKVKPIIEEILKVVIEDGKGIEINTSCYRYGLNDLTPGREILCLYRQLGGRIITIGSDSHKREDLGNYIEETKHELRKLGFKEYCTYEKMQPIFHTL